MEGCKRAAVWRTGTLCTVSCAGLRFKLKSQPHFKGDRAMSGDWAAAESQGDPAVTPVARVGGGEVMMGICWEEPQTEGS